jgi:ABC-type branched-subunit amino acid transport system permease subunit
MIARILPYAVLVAGFCLLPLWLPWLSFVFVLALGTGFAALGVALLLRAGLISLGHGGFYALGAYATASFSRVGGMGELVVLLVATLVISAAAGAVVGAFMVRYRAIFFAMLNLAVSMVFFTLLSKLYHITGGTDGLRVQAPTVLGLAIDRATFEAVLLYGGFLLFWVVAYAVHRYLASPMGQALSAVHTNEVRLEYIGISVFRVLLAAYAISAALAGLGGAISALAIGHVVPEMGYWTVSGQLVLVAVLGGIGGVVGPLIGAVFLEAVRSLATGYFAEAWNLVVGVALIGVIFFLPAGLYGLMKGYAEKRS